jgi:nitronate monooxygenase
VAAALAMGCVGVWIGTRFLATNEAGAPDIIKQHIIEANDEDTRVSTMFTGKTLRSLFSEFHVAWNESGLNALPFPLQVLVSSALLSSFIKANKEEYIGGFAGQISGIIKEIKPAGQVLEDMVEQAVEILTDKLPRDVKAE